MTMRRVMLYDLECLVIKKQTKKISAVEMRM